MKPRLIDRLLTIMLCSDLVLSFWYLSMAFPISNQAVSNVF